ncbi:MAG: hypothetical protein IKH04_02475 [Kiritimatiellae bacterium]|nr:hypothetical protein [Kiritimatiellia bacterium]
MTIKTKVFVASAAALSFLLCLGVFAQDGLNGELDDLLGLGGDDAPLSETIAEAGDAADAAAEDVAAKVDDAIEAAAATGEELADILAEPVAEPESAAEVPEATPAPADEVAELTGDVAGASALLDTLEAAAPEAPAVEEAVAEAVPEAPAVEEAVAEASPEAPAVEEAVAEAAPEAPAVEEAVAEASPEAPAVEEAVAEAAPEAPAVEAPVAAPEAVEVAVAEPEAVETPVAEPEAVEVAEAEPAAAEPVASEPEAVAAEPVDEVAAGIAEINLLELMRRKALDEHGKKSLDAAKAEMKDGNFVEAQRLFEEASKFLANRPENEDMLAAASAGVAESIYRQAEGLYKRGDLEGAIKLARQAREHNHRKAADLIDTIQHDIDNPPEEKVVTEVKRWNDRDYRKNREQVRARLKRARQYLITGEYDRARTELELILRDNPYDADAILMLKRVSDRTYDSNTQEFNATRATMIEQVRKTWTASGRYAIDVPDSVDPNGGTIAEGGQVNRAGNTPEEEIEAKMRNITIPEINFKNATISEVVDFFIDASREYDDPQIPPEQRGVNLILKISQSAPAEASLESEDIFAPAAAQSDNGIPPVSFSARYMSLWDGLQYACELSRLKFRLRGNTVMIMPMNEADVDMVSRTYTVLPSIEERASSMTTALSTRSVDDEGRSFFDQGENSAATAGVDWKQLFEDMGVKWPNGSSVKYLPSINKMRVLNTPENLVEFEKALQELNVTPRQVEIEARFVEVAQTDLESLGFEWLLTDDWEIAKNKKNPEQHIKVSKGSGTASVNRYLSAGADLGNGIAVNAVNDALLSISSVLTNPELGFVLHMLSQQANTDLLSAPKVVTMNNEEAIIKVVHEYIYPTEYEIKENDLDSDSDVIQVSYPMVEPQEFSMREVGVILQVTPQVSDDGQMISLQLNPQIISEPEWLDYGFDYPLRMTGDSAETLHLQMRQPVFKVRSVSTKISIYNGATVVMGGMITEARNEVNDKVPFFGDIPFIGRLFRSTYEQSEKRNLLIFVTARMVDPAGRTLKTNASDGATVPAAN